MWSRQFSVLLICHCGNCAQFREEIQLNLHEITRLHIILKDGESQSQTTNAYVEQVNECLLKLCPNMSFLNPDLRSHSRFRHAIHIHILNSHCM